MGNSWLRVFVQGENLCNGEDGCGQLLVAGEPVGFRADLDAVGDMLSPRIMRWTDDEIEFEIVDPAGTGDTTVRVRVGDRLSDEAVFNRPVPFFDALQDQPEWSALDPAGG